MRNLSEDFPSQLLKARIWFCQPCQFFKWFLLNRPVFALSPTSDFRFCSWDFTIFLQRLEASFHVKEQFLVLFVVSRDRFSFHILDRIESVDMWINLCISQWVLIAFQNSTGFFSFSRSLGKKSNPWGEPRFVNSLNHVEFHNNIGLSKIYVTLNVGRLRVDIKSDDPINNEIFFLSMLN